jgi:REP element-mobilizing transposase RayT
MSTHRKHSVLNQFDFVTFTCYQWLPLLERSEIYNFLPTWIEEINKRHVLICGFVFMPNHIHLLVFVKEQSKGLNHVIGESKRFLAYEIVSRLKRKKETEILEKLAAGVQKRESIKGKKHQVFRLSFDAKAVEGEEAIHAVLDYLPRQGGHSS